MPRRQSLVLALLAVVCAAVLWSLYQWYQARYIRPFSETTVLFDGAALRLPAELAGSGRIRVVHLWDPPCPCNVGNQQHLAELLARFGDRVSFHVWQKPGSRGHLPDTLKALQPLAELPGAEQLPASPAVAIWAADGTLAYVGPYSEGATCTSANSFIEPVLEALLAGRPVHSTGSLALGCYCSWTDAQ
ncbi:DUF6436 domain-containing protein [Pseudomonas oryzae]|uniref:DUF6436 domain-containing protein n=1 Tax=Pseudomonas oryzae TaxID=1392877 RepID=A0A1H1YAD0_9PSED|nr:DUF6436 domain-containing protein [Pseudomonas oryzae]SDT18387.1 hypothetical protein SAMN05216221_3718 [Pseudomonas oryzae]